MFQIRNEEERDYQIVEEITRKAFYNMYMPGCVEHYLVHIMRGHEDFIPELEKHPDLRAGKYSPGVSEEGVRENAYGTFF